MPVDSTTQDYNESLHAGFQHPNPVPHSIEVLRRWVGTSRHILDVGCGSGFMGAMFVEWGNEVHGVEISPSAVEAARVRGVRAVVGDVEEALPETLGTFPLVTCIEVLEHLVHPDRTLAHIARMLEPDGRLIVTVPNTAFWSHRLMMLAGRMIFVGQGKYPTIAEPHIRHFTPRTLTALLESSGFEVVEIRGTFTGFPGTLRPFLPFPANKLVGGIQRITRGLDFLCDRFPAPAAAGLFVLARRKPGSPLPAVPEKRRTYLRAHASGGRVVVGGGDGGWIDPSAPLPFEEGGASVVEIGPDWANLLTPADLLVRCLRLLKPGGRVVVTVDDSVSWPRRLRLLFGRFFPGVDRLHSAAWCDPRIRFFTKRTLAETLRAYGLAEITVRRAREGSARLLRAEAVVSADRPAAPTALVR